jgi:hypothetical protein
VTSRPLLDGTSLDVKILIESSDCQRRAREVIAPRGSCLCDPQHG